MWTGFDRIDAITELSRARTQGQRCLVIGVPVLLAVVEHECRLNLAVKEWVSEKGECKL
jgi:hypothetical protein